jgi:ABC-type glycerol-3-phosphate transport system substrate-binding protein
MRMKKMATMTTAMSVMLALLAACGQTPTSPSGKTDTAAVVPPQDEKAEVLRLEKTFSTLPLRIWLPPNTLILS